MEDTSVLLESPREPDGYTDLEASLLVYEQEPSAVLLLAELGKELLVNVDDDRPLVVNEQELKTLLTVENTLVVVTGPIKETKVTENLTGFVGMKNTVVKTMHFITTYKHRKTGT